MPKRGGATHSSSSSGALALWRSHLTSHRAVIRAVTMPYNADFVDEAMFFHRRVRAVAKRVVRASWKEDKKKTRNT